MEVSKASLEAGWLQGRSHHLWCILSAKANHEASMSPKDGEVTLHPFKDRTAGCSGKGQRTGSRFAVEMLTDVLPYSKSPSQVP